MKRGASPGIPDDGESIKLDGLDPRLQSLSENLKIHKVFNEEINLHMKQFVKLLDDLVSESTIISVEYQKYSEQLNDQDFSVSSIKIFNTQLYYLHLFLYFYRKECR